MPLKDAELKKLLLEQNYLSETDITRGEEQAKSHKIPLQNALSELGILNQGLLENAVAEYFGLDHYDPKEAPPSSETVLLLPEEVARTFNVVVVEKKGKSVVVVTSDPSNELIEEAIRMNFEQEEAVLPTADGKKTKKKKKKSKFSFGKKAADRKRFRGKIELLYAPRSMIESLLVHYRKPLR